MSRAIRLLRKHEPADGYYVAFSGGKDSQVILRLCEDAGVKHEARYNVTTVDPPELVRFIKSEYPRVGWNRPEHSMLWMVEYGRPGTPPTRLVRWCCRIYKEHGGDGRKTVIGVRAAESPRRKVLWHEITKHLNGKDTIVCPIVHWSDEDVWGFLGSRFMSYCCLYDEGFRRLGCIGCPLAGSKQQLREFARWPRYGELWHKAVVGNWRRHQPPNMRRDGKPYYHASFKTGEEFWDWWISGKRRQESDPFDEGCQSVIAYTNDAGPEDRETGT